MNISELQETLRRIKRKNGDLPVLFRDRNGQVNGRSGVRITSIVDPVTLEPAKKVLVMDGPW